MAEQKEILRIFIASSAELMEERKMMNAVFNELNGILSHIQLKDIRWEIDMAGGSVEGDHIQDDINEKLLDDCPVVILLLYSRVGKFTLQEYELALRKRKKLFVYFKQGFAPADEAQTRSLGDLLRFKSRIEQENKILYTGFSQPQDLKLLLYHDLLHYLREQYLLADNSIMRVFEALKLTAVERRCLDFLVMLPPGAYSEREVLLLIQATATQKTPLLNALESLEKKGILSVSTDGKELYRVQDVIRKNLARPDLYGKEDFAHLVDSLVNRLRVDLEASDFARQMESIRFVEVFLRYLKTHAHSQISLLKEKLAVSYLKIFGTSSLEHSEKAAALLQQLLLDDQQDEDNPEILTRRKRLLSEVYSGLADLFAGEDRSRYLERARALLDDIDPAQLASPKEVLRFHLEQLSIKFKLDGFSESTHNRLKLLFSNNPAFLDLIRLEDSDLFLRYFYLCKNFQAYDLAETIMLKLAALEEQEYGTDNFRLCKTYLNCGEIAMLNNKKMESINFLRKAFHLAERAAQDPALLQNINALIAIWTSKFVPEQ